MTQKEALAAFEPDSDTIYIKCSSKEIAREIKYWLCDVGEQGLMEWLEARDVKIKIPRYHTDKNYVFIDKE